MAKQRYLIKKAKKKRKLDSARKAAAPKNKQWRAEDGGVGENKPTIAPELGNDDVEDAQGDPGRHGTASVVETEKDGFPRPAEAGPSSFMTGGQLESGGEGHDAADAVDQNADRERRRHERRERQEKKEISASNKPKGEEDAAVEENPNALTHAVNGDRTRKETVKEIAMQGTELEQRRPERKEKLAKRKQKVERGTGIQNELDSSAVLAKSVETAGGEINDAVSEEDERERRRREKKEKRANRDRTWKKNHVSSEDGQIGDQEAPDDRIGGGETIEQDLMTSPASPPPLEAFPLPRPAPAPDPRILARQGLPVGLTDATFVDQELRIPIYDIEYASQGVKEKGMSERMGKRLAEIGVEDFFAGSSASTGLHLSS